MKKHGMNYKDTKSPNRDKLSIVVQSKYVVKHVVCS